MTNAARLRIDRGLSQYEAARAIKVPYWCIRDIERGALSPQSRYAAAFVKFYGVPLETLMEKYEGDPGERGKYAYAKVEIEQGGTKYKIAKEFCKEHRISADALPYMLSNGLRIITVNRRHYISEEDYAEYLKYHSAPKTVIQDDMLPIVTESSRYIYYPVEQIAYDYRMKADTLIAMKDKIPHIERNGRYYMARDGLNKTLKRTGNMANADVLDAFMNKLKK